MAKSSARARLRESGTSRASRRSSKSTAAAKRIGNKRKLPYSSLLVEASESSPADRQWAVVPGVEDADEAENARRGADGREEVEQQFVADRRERRGGVMTDCRAVLLLEGRLLHRIINVHDVRQR